MNKPIIFTDLDGTLLDPFSYSFEKASQALALLKKMGIPLVISSSKTKKEILHYREKLSNHDPFISENGGGIFIPKDYFGGPPQLQDVEIFEEDCFHVVILGSRYNDLRKVIIQLRHEGFHVQGFGDISAAEVAEITGLSIEEAEMAKERDFDEPFLFQGTESDAKNLLNSIHTKGLTMTMGNFFHLLGKSDKGRAVSILRGLYRKHFGDIVTFAIGDSPNDIPMLEQVDYPVIVQLPDGSYDRRIDLPHLIKAEGIGPDGWNKSVLSFLEKLAF